nr:UPF0280 family protein [Oxalobacteraceae bacterium]
MVRACYPHRAQFITPMAAVAGAVADELIGFFAAEPEIRRASINNGGDIALHLQAGQRYTIGLVTDIASLDAEPQSHFEVDASMPVRGVATSGWRGRSMSLGIADSVIQRAPASALKDDADLGDLLVTTHVGPLPAELIQQALDDGAKYAQYLLGEGLIFAAALTLQGQSRLLGEPLDRLALQVRRAA